MNDIVRSFREGLTAISTGLCIKEDDSLLGNGGGESNGTDKLMEDVAALFDNRFAVRSNGDVYMLEFSGGRVVPRKIINGSGYAPVPAPALHAGKIFKDASSWALIDLRAARESGLTIPTDGLSYDQPITREKFAEVSVKLYEALSGKKAVASAVNPFTDTSNPEILKAYSLGIVNGTGATIFSPDTQITREGIATMLMRTVNAAGITLPNVSAVQFSDSGQISSWAKDAVDAMARANIIKGAGNNCFEPQGTATVEQAIIMANRILQ